MCRSDGPCFPLRTATIAPESRMARSIPRRAAVSRSSSIASRQAPCEG
jgi:hypothetical protein